MKIVILGSSGFIGAHLLEHAARHFSGEECLGLSRADADLTKPASVDQIGRQMDSHSALIICSGIKRQLGDTFPIFDDNMLIAKHLCGILSRSRPVRAIYLSSAAVYGEETHDSAITEQTKVDPQSLYGISKFTTERLLLRAAKEAEVPLLILRPALTYGKGDSSKGYGPAAFHEAIITKQTLTLWGDGSELREFLYVKDLARLICELVASPFQGVLNPASGISRSYRDCAEIMRNAAGGRAEIAERNRSRTKVDNRYDPALLRSLLPQFRFTPLEDGLAEMYAECGNKN